MTDAKRNALRWLACHNGDGCFMRSGVLLAAGESAPVVRGTWNALAKLGYVELYKPARGHGRCKLTDSGRQEAQR